MLNKKKKKNSVLMILTFLFGFAWIVFSLVTGSPITYIFLVLTWFNGFLLAMIAANYYLR